VRVTWLASWRPWGPPEPASDRDRCARPLMHRSVPHTPDGLANDLGRPVNRPVDLLRATRPRQWPKNLLVLAAPLAGGRLLQPGVTWRALAALVVFILASASVYLLNDLLDRERDAHHPLKRDRPVASGAVSTRAAALTSAALATLSLAGAAATGRPQLVVVIAGYLVITTVYSRWLKHQPLLDIALIAAGFLLRAAAGGAATDTPLSTLFLITATAGALFIAAGKRASELSAAQGGSTQRTPCRGTRARAPSRRTAANARVRWATSAPSSGAQGRRSRGVGPRPCGRRRARATASASRRAAARRSSRRTRASTRAARR
jgi:hypothetical protein